MVTEQQYDELVNTVQREFAEMTEKYFKLENRLEELERKEALRTRDSPRVEDY